jgi:hypothetical protein
MKSKQGRNSDMKKVELAAPEKRSVPDCWFPHWEGSRKVEHLAATTCLSVSLHFLPNLRNCAIAQEVQEHRFAPATVSYPQTRS